MRRLISVWGVAGLALSLVVASLFGAAPDDTTARVAAYLEAGEFAPAVALARQVATRETRDALLGQIAAAQNRAGAVEASYATAAEMDSDVARSAAVTDLSSRPVGRTGGAGQADFDTLIDLITSTVKPTSWDNVGGAGSIKGFDTGVRVDALGVLKPILHEDRDSSSLASLRNAAAQMGAHDDVRRGSPLRKVSLTRLERQIQIRLAQGQDLSEEMQYLAGLERIQYVLVYPEQGEIILAGPAGNWTTDREGRVVAEKTGRPVLRLDDFVVILRQIMSRGDAVFGCSITPTNESLARAQAFIAQSAKTPLKPGAAARDAWLKQLREQLGQQVIDVYGIDPQTRVGRVLVEADYRMKLVGIGLEDGVLGVQNYLASLNVPPGQAAPPLDVLRWWFTLNYDAVLATPEHNAFEIRGQGVKVLSENELLTALGQQVHTGQSRPLNEQFAEDFTKHFAELSVKYPVYAELQNIFDLALVAALIRAEGLADRVDWHATCFSDPKAFQVEHGFAPKLVDTVINHRVIRPGVIVAAVSGGVRVDPAKLVQKGAIETDNYGLLSGQRTAAKPAAQPRDVWWWD